MWFSNNLPKKEIREKPQIARFQEKRVNPKGGEGAAPNFQEQKGTPCGAGVFPHATPLKKRTNGEPASRLGKESKEKSSQMRKRKSVNSKSNTDVASR